MAELRGAAALVAACMGCVCLAASAQEQRAAGMVVHAREQARRDSDRIRILNNELAQEQAAATDAAKRRAAHLAASDLQAVQQAEEAQQRAAVNIAALQRELAAAQHSASNTARPTAKSGTAPASDAPWWDVYAKPRGAPVPGTSTPSKTRATSAAPDATTFNR